MGSDEIDDNSAVEALAHGTDVSPAEKTITLKQSELAGLLSDTRKHGKSLGHKEAMSQIQQEQQVPQNPNVNNSNGLSEEHINLIRREAETVAKTQLENEFKRHQESIEHQKRQDEVRYQTQEAEQFKSRVAQGTQKYGHDYDNFVQKEFIPAVAMSNANELVYAINKLPNGDDVLNEFSKNPEKLSRVLDFYRNGMYQQCAKELQTISDGYTKSDQNKETYHQSFKSEPINEITPSHTGVDNDLAGAISSKIRF
jgi:hypothetical protein